MDGSQQKRLKLNKVLLEKVTVADASQDQKVVPASQLQEVPQMVLLQKDERQKHRNSIFMFFTTQPKLYQRIGG